MTVAGIEKVIPALGIDKMLDEGVPQATLDRVAPGVKTQDVNNLFGALDRAIPGLGKVVKQNANVGVAAGINALGKEADAGRQEGARVPAALRRRRGVSGTAEGRRRSRRCFERDPEKWTRFPRDKREAFARITRQSPNRDR